MPRDEFLGCRDLEEFGELPVMRTNLSIPADHFVEAPGVAVAFEHEIAVVI